jgi:hypothetical protein
MSPFLTVQVQLWERELARLVSEVAPDRTRFEISINVGAGEKRKYLPVHNCGDCGRTAWVSLIDSNLDLSDSNLDVFTAPISGMGKISGSSRLQVGSRSRPFVNPHPRRASNSSFPCLRKIMLVK